MRTPEEIIGANAVIQLAFEGYEIIKAATATGLFDAGPSDFDVLWNLYPHKVGKLAAQKAYKAARNRKVPHSVVLDGLQRYIATKPLERPWLNLATFVNQERWSDQPAIVAPALKGRAAARQSLREEIENEHRDQSSDPRYAGRLHHFPGDR